MRVLVFWVCVVNRIAKSWFRVVIYIYVDVPLRLHL